MCRDTKKLYLQGPRGPLPNFFYSGTGSQFFSFPILMLKVPSSLPAVSMVLDVSFFMRASRIPNRMPLDLARKVTHNFSVQIHNNKSPILSDLGFRTTLSLEGSVISDPSRTKQRFFALFCTTYVILQNVHVSSLLFLEFINF